MSMKKEALIFGATGNIGGATARELLSRGWKIRAVTRDPQSDKAQKLSEEGAEVVFADMEQQDSLEAAFQGIHRVLSVQNWTTSGVEGEARQGKLVADVAKEAGVEHLIYISAGTGQADTGIPHFDSKLEVEAYMRDLGLPFTIIRPGPFMELMTANEFFPPVAIWGTAPRVMGWETPSPWVAVQDIGIAATNVFENPDEWIDRDIHLIGDVKSLAECREVMKATHGKSPLRIPMPLWMFRKMAGDEFEMMWRWLGQIMEEKGDDWIKADIQSARQVNPQLQTVDQWISNA